VTIEASDASALYTYFRRVVGNPDEAKELLQESLLEATEQRDRYDPARGRFRAWLFGIGQNRLRKRARRRETEIRLAHHVPVPEAPPTPVDRIEEAQRLQRLEAAIAALSEVARHVFVLRYQEGMTCEAIGSLLELSPNAVSMHLHRARESVRQSVRDGAEGGEL